MYVVYKNLIAIRKYYTANFIFSLNLFVIL